MKKVAGTKVNKKVPEIRISFHPKVKPALLPKVSCARSAYELFLESWNIRTIELREEARMMYLNSSHAVVGYHLLGIGGVGSTVLDLRLKYAVAVKCCVISLILAHSHPSDSTKPSEADKLTTSYMVQSGFILGIQLLDHLIITRHKFYSFADNGLLDRITVC